MAVRQAKALTDGETLASLFSKLEPDAERLSQFSGSRSLAAGFVLRSRDDPGQRILYIIARKPPVTRMDPPRWIADNFKEVDPLLVTNGGKISHCNVIIPGSWPDKAYRERRGAATVRLTSAVHHLWVDRLRVHDATGEMDVSRRASLMQRLGGRWSAEEEKRFTAPAMAEVAGDHVAQVAQMLPQPHPDVASGGVTVVYGPGGIGKTFFLRRIA